MKIVDPYDSTKTYPSVQALVKHYSGMVSTDILAQVIDQLAARPNMAGASNTLNITGMGANQTIPHGLKDDSGNKVKPSAWQIVQFKACDTIQVVSVDDTNITVYVTNKGEVTLAVFG